MTLFTELLKQMHRHNIEKTAHLQKDYAKSKLSLFHNAKKSLFVKYPILPRPLPHTADRKETPIRNSPAFEKENISLIPSAWLVLKDANNEAVGGVFSRLYFSKRGLFIDQLEGKGP